MEREREREIKKKEKRKKERRRGKGLIRLTTASKWRFQGLTGRVESG